MGFFDYGKPPLTSKFLQNLCLNVTPEMLVNCHVYVFFPPFSYFHYLSSFYNGFDKILQLVELCNYLFIY